MLSHITKTGGLTDHLGTDDLRKVEQKIKDGDQYAKMVLNSMIYQIAKTAGSMAVVLKGQTDRILLTGGMAHSEYLVSSLKEYLGWIADFTVYPGEFELEALAAGALRVARGEENQQRNIRAQTSGPGYSFADSPRPALRAAHRPLKLPDQILPDRR